jgi:hypothetical protein
MNLLDLISKSLPTRRILQLERVSKHQASKCGYKHQHQHNGHRRRFNFN